MENEEYLTDEEDIASRVSGADVHETKMKNESSPVFLSKQVESQENDDADVLDNLSDDVRAAHREFEVRALEISRSVV